MRTPGANAENYGMGWMRKVRTDGLDLIWHSGDVSAHHAQLLLIPEKSLAIMLMFNSNHMIYGVSVFPQLAEVLIDFIVYGKTPSSSIPMGIVLNLFGVLFLFTTVSAVIKIAQVKRWEKKMIGKSRGDAAKSAVKDLIVPVILVFGIAFLSVKITNRGIDVQTIDHG